MYNYIHIVYPTSDILYGATYPNYYHRQVLVASDPPKELLNDVAKCLSHVASFVSAQDQDPLE